MQQQLFCFNLLHFYCDDFFANDDFEFVNKPSSMIRSRVNHPCEIKNQSRVSQDAECVSVRLMNQN